MDTQGELVLAGTPIGSYRDASPALRELLSTADLIAAEDTRRLADLLRRLEVSPAGTVVSYFEGNEARRALEIRDAVATGATVALVSDAGMPAVSDPGYRAVVACLEADLRIRALPGPSAVLTALAVSGLPTDRFCFEGFLPRKAGERRERLRALHEETRTMVFFEAPHRLSEFLETAKEVFGPAHRGVICRELTKPYEEIVRGDLETLSSWAAGRVRGEVTVVLAGATSTKPAIPEALEAVVARLRAGERLSGAVAAVASDTGVNRNQLYEAALAARKELT